MKAVPRTLGLVLMACSIPLSSLAADAGPLSIDEAVAELVQANPGLAAIKARADALAELPDQLGALPDPSLSLKFLNLPVDSFSFNQEGMTQTQLGFTQKLPFPGKLGLRQDAAGAMAVAAAFGVDELRLKLIRDVKIVWWNLFFLDRALDVLDNNKMLLRQLIDVAESKYSVGKGLQQDVLLAQLELSRLLDSQMDLEGRRRNEAIRLATLLDRPATDDIQLPQTVGQSFSAFKPVQELIQAAKSHRPLLSVREQQLRAARLRIDLAEKDYYPDFSVGIAYGFRRDAPDGTSRDDLMSLMLGMTLPIYSGSKQARAVDQRNAERLGQRYALFDTHNQVEQEIAQALSDHRRDLEKADLFKTAIIPQARQTVASMLAAYQVNKVDFLNVMRSQITLYNYETQYWNAFSRARQARARLIAAVGEENVHE